jgi:alpha-beta hydrolase superfamily lysophospholipase
MFVIFLFALFTLSSQAKADAFWQRLTWASYDGVQLVGFYHHAARPEAVTWVLLHGLGSFKEEWEAFSRKMVAQGSGVLIYDARGHHESNRLASGQTITYQDWKTGGPGSPWAQMPGDLASAVQYLEKTYRLPEKKIAVGGASVGANVALLYASEHPEVPGLILLSAGVEYAGLNIERAWHRSTFHQVFAAASPEDHYAYSTLRFLAHERRDVNLRIAEGPGGEHGVNMFKDPVFTKKLLDWIGQVQ